MGFLDVYRTRRLERSITAAFPATSVDPSTLPIATPWSKSHLEKVLAQDVFGQDVPVNTRSAAMRIPSVARARNLVVSSICRMPLVDQVDGAPAETQPLWLTRSRHAAPQLRLAWTVDDLIFYGMSCWLVERYADGRMVSDAHRLNWGEWSLNADMRVEVLGHEVPNENVIVFTGLHEGVLDYGKDSLDDTRTLYRNVRTRLATPSAGVNLHQTGGRDLTDDEIDTLIDRWAIARRGGNGGVSFTSKDIEAVDMPGDDGKLLIEARNAAAVDVARVIGVSAGLIDATTPTASLNYETRTGRNEEFVDRDLELYITPLEARLSQPDVTPNGHTIVVDQGEFTRLPSDTSTPAVPAVAPATAPAPAPLES